LASAGFWLFRNLGVCWKERDSRRLKTLNHLLKNDTHNFIDIQNIVLSSLIYCHASSVPWRIITGPGLDDWIY
jgi:hypothetical protein